MNCETNEPAMCAAKTERYCVLGAQPKQRYTALGAKPSLRSNQSKIENETISFKNIFCAPLKSKPHNFFYCERATEQNIRHKLAVGRSLHNFQEIRAKPSRNNLPTNKIQKIRLENSKFILEL